MNNKINSNNKQIIIAIILILGIGAGILGYLQYRNKTSPVPSISPIASVSPSISTTPAFTPPPEVWETYTNSQLGFSIKYPQMVLGVYRCSPYKPFNVPVKIFEDNKDGIIYMAEEYYYEAPYSSELNDYTGPCEKIIYSLESLKKIRNNVVDINGKVQVNENPFLTRVFVIKNINNNIELTKFIKNTYGSGCIAGSKNIWNQQKGVYEIVIKGEDWDKGADLGTTTCPINAVIKVLYAPEKNKIMSVILGQECGFGTDASSQSYKCYDEEMINSFRFK